MTVSVGPGQHGHRLLHELSRRGMLRSSIRSWPSFCVERWGEGGGSGRVLRHRWYDRVARLSWGAWRRIPGWRRRQTPTVWLYALHDWLGSRYVTPCDLFLGWTQVSLRSLRRAARGGSVTILEHPMAHVRAWTAVAQEEYERWGRGAPLYYSLFPGRVIRRMEREYAAADHIMVLSSFARDSFVKCGADGGKILCLPLGVDVEHFRPARPPDGRFRVIYVGRVALLKGVHYLLRAFAELALPDAELWLVGPVLPEMAPFLREYAGAFRHLGEVAHADLPACYGACSVAVLPSLSDGFGLVILEAMASGLPVIATDHTAGPDLVEDGVHGFIVPTRDVEALKTRLLHLYRHRDEAARMGARARERVAAAFTWDHYGERLATLYDRVAGDARGRGAGS